MKSLSQNTVILLLVIIILVLVSIMLGLVVNLVFSIENIREQFTESRNTRDSQNQPIIPYPLVDIGVVTSYYYLQIVDLYIARKDNPDGTFDVEITIGLKSTGDRVIIIKNIEVPDAMWKSPTLNISLRPGDTWQQSFLIINDKPCNELIGGGENKWGEIWRKGSGHLVIVRYIIQGNPEEREVSQRGFVT